MRTQDPLILCLHAVSAHWRSPLAIAPELLRAQLGRLAGRGFTGLTLSEAERRRAAGEPTARTVVVTFDDGFASVVRAVPVLRELGWPATVFVLPPFVDRGAPLAWDGTRQWLGTPSEPELAPLSWEALDGLAQDGWEIGAHSATHPRLTLAADDRLTAELVLPRAQIAARYGTCTAVAYPYGAVDDRVAAAAHRAGHRVGVTLDSAHPDTPLTRRRVGLYPRDGGWRFAVKTRFTRTAQPARQPPVLQEHHAPVAGIPHR